MIHSKKDRCYIGKYSVYFDTYKGLCIKRGLTRRYFYYGVYLVHIPNITISLSVSKDIPISYKLKFGEYYLHISSNHTNLYKSSNKALINKYNSNNIFNILEQYFYTINQCIDILFPYEWREKITAVFLDYTR